MTKWVYHIFTCIFKYRLQPENELTPFIDTTYWVILGL